MIAVIVALPVKCSLKFQWQKQVARS